MIRSPATRLAFALALSVLAAAVPTARQPQPAAPKTAARATKRMSAQRVSAPPLIDGALDDIARRGVEPVSDFVQAEPLEGQPATEKTEVRLLYDEVALYVGVNCFDSEPSQIVTT